MNDRDKVATNLQDAARVVIRERLMAEWGIVGEST